MRKKFFIFLILFIISVSCDNEVDIVSPSFGNDTILENTFPLADSLIERLEGVYKVDIGHEQFGSHVVLKWERGKLSIFGARQGTYFILNSGQTDSTILFEGMWRHAISTSTGLVRFVINKRGGLSNVLGDSLFTGSFVLNGKYGFENNVLENLIKFIYVRPFSEKVKNKKFFILAHRGGGRNSDYVGASENSLEIFPYAEHFGANGIEIDVKLSKDGIPFLYHDTDINLRLTKDSPIWGPIEDFTYKQLRTFVILKNGERIPALSEALKYIIEETDLDLVWLDMKSEKNAMPKVIEIQKNALTYAESLGREIYILIGLPSEDQMNLLMENENYQNIPSLCELSVDDVRRVNSLVWAPRWTMGTQNSTVTQIQDEGRFAFTWTLDQIQFISEFIQESNFNGILTNYPTIVSYFYYVQ